MQQWPAMNTEIMITIIIEILLLSDLYSQGITVFPLFGLGSFLNCTFITKIFIAPLQRFY